MGKIIIATVGTSIFTNISFKKENEIFKKNYNEFKVDGSNEEYIRSFIKEEVKSSNNINSISAEIKSLNKIGIDKDDIIFFLATDTREGKLSSNILKDFYNERFNCKAYVEQIKGLQVIDAEKFRKVGIKNLIEKILDILEKYYYEKNIIFNPTGGFKGVVPYITLTGMIYQKKITYIFENTEGLISLPPIPIEFNFSLIEEYEEKFNKLYENHVLEKEDFFKGIDYETRTNKFLPFIEEEGKFITFSALGELIYRRYISLKHIPEIHVSSEAIKMYKKIKDEKTLEIINKMFMKLLDKDLRKNNEHEKVDEEKTDLKIMKEGSTSRRIFYYLDDDLPKVCLIYTDHDYYENALSRGIAFKNGFKDFEKIKIV